MHINYAIRRNSFSMYFQCENTTNCFVVTRDGGELSELIEDGCYFQATEIGGKRVQITIGEKQFLLENRMRSLADAKGFNHWMAPLDVVPQRVNLLPAH